MSNSVTDIAIVGGGAAGIAAARALHEAGADYRLLEARDRLGGRAWTVDDASGFALDMGCGWLHSADQNPWVEIARAQGRNIDKTPPPWERASAHVGPPDERLKSFGGALAGFRGAVESLAEDAPDRPASDFLDPSGPSNALIDAVSTYYSGAELHKVSSRDLARYDDTGVNWRIPEGYGRVVAAHGADLNVRLNCEVERIDHGGRSLRIETSRGAVEARAVIVALPSRILAERETLFFPDLPDKRQAASDLPLGLADKLYLSLAGAEEFEPDSRAFGVFDRTQTAAYQFRPLGRPLIEAYFGGDLAADLEAEGEPAFFAFASRELRSLFGADFLKRIAPRPMHGWARDVWARGSYSYARPGKADSRATLAEPIDNRLFFAGEACSRSDYSTAHGAYRTGVVAAGQALAAIRRRRGD